MAENADYFSKIKSAADAGDIDSCLRLGLAYAVGGVIGEQDIQKNPPQSYLYYKKAADQGSAKGMHEVFWGLRYGLGVEKNIEEACKWLEKSVNADYLPALADMAWFYLTGRDPYAEDHNKAFQFLKKYGDWIMQGAADSTSHYKPSSTVLYYPLCLATGKGCEKNPKMAYDYILSLKQNGFTYAREILDNRKITVQYLSDFFYGADSKSSLEEILAFADNKQPAGEVGKVEQKPPVTLESALAKLEALIGLGEVKAQVKSFINRQNLNTLRQAQGLKAMKLNLHIVFSGAPGTGKTTVARILGDILHCAGLLEKGHVVEVSQPQLVGQYVGTTSPLVKARVEEALGGILFIDEAYSLLDKNNSPSTIKTDAINTLLKLMEEYEGRFMVIAAGYPDEMDEFVRFNPGLHSRFRETIFFAGYTDEELSEIYKSIAEQGEYVLSPGCDEALATAIKNAPNRHVVHFGNARYVRNLFEETLEILANRVANLASPTREDLMAITAFDIHAAADNKRRL